MRTYVYNTSEHSPLVLMIWPITFGARGVEISEKGTWALTYSPGDPSHRNSGRHKAIDLADALQELAEHDGEVKWETRIDGEEDADYLKRHWNLMEELYVLEGDLDHWGLKKEPEYPLTPEEAQAAIERGCTVKGCQYGRFHRLNGHGRLATKHTTKGMPPGWDTAYYESIPERTTRGICHYKIVEEEDEAEIEPTAVEHQLTLFEGGLKHARKR